MTIESSPPAQQQRRLPNNLKSHQHNDADETALFDWWIFLSAFAAGIFGAVAHVADVYTCLDVDPRLADTVTSHHDILKLASAFELIRAKPTRDFAIGHVLAMTCIPLGFVGSYHLSGILRRQHQAMGTEYEWMYRALRHTLVATLFITYMAGTIMHCTWTFVSLTLNVVANHPSQQRQTNGSHGDEQLLQDLITALTPYFELTSHITIHYLLNTANLAIVVLILARQLPWHPLMIIVTPIPTIWILQTISQVLPFVGFRLYIAVASYNLSSAILWLASAFYYAAYHRTMFLHQKNKKKLL